MYSLPTIDNKTILTATEGFLPGYMAWSIFFGVGAAIDRIRAVPASAAAEGCDKQGREEP
jgi:hypothetical protein